MNKGPVLVLGACSDIAQAVSHRFARAGHPLQLAARDPARLSAHKADLEIRYAVKVTLHLVDALDPASISAALDALPELPEIAVCAIGVMGDQEQSETDPEAAITALRSNFEGVALIMSFLANRFETRGSGTLVGISSVAGERGRASNYFYGSAKAGFTAFLSGLRNRLSDSGVHVVTVLPGFVATRMTADMDLPPKLTASPEQVAAAIERAVSRRRNVIYVKPIWRLIMAIICALPEQLFKKTRL